MKINKTLLMIHLRPSSPSLRDRWVVERQRSRSFKKLLFSLNRSQGRDITGNIVSYHKGGGNLFRYRCATYRLDLLQKPGVFLGYDFDNYRTGWLGLIKYINGSYGYFLAASSMRAGSFINAYKFIRYSNRFSRGDCIPLSKVTKGMSIYNVSSENNKMRGCFSRSAGSRCLVRQVDERKGVVTLRLPSKKLKVMSFDCFACVGQTSNLLHRYEHYSKAGVGKIFNYRPSVRGEAMNAVDHHHGGKTKGGKQPKTPWGKIIKK